MALSGSPVGLLVILTLTLGVPLLLWTLRTRPTQKPSALYCFESPPPASNTHELPVDQLILWFQFPLQAGKLHISHMEDIPTKKQDYEGYSLEDSLAWPELVTLAPELLPTDELRTWRVALSRPVCFGTKHQHHVINWR